MNSKWNRLLGILICLLVGSFVLTSTTTAHGAETKASVTKKITSLEK